MNLECKKTIPDDDSVCNQHRSIKMWDKSVMFATLNPHLTAIVKNDALQLPYVNDHPNGITVDYRGCDGHPTHALLTIINDCWDFGEDA